MRGDLYHPMMLSAYWSGLKNVIAGKHHATSKALVQQIRIHSHIFHTAQEGFHKKSKNLQIPHCHQFCIFQLQNSQIRLKYESKKIYHH